MSKHASLFLFGKLFTLMLNRDLSLEPGELFILASLLFSGVSSLDIPELF